MSELRSKEDLFDFEKDGIYYKKTAGNCLMILRQYNIMTWWKTAKHVEYTIESNYKSYIGIEIPKEVDGMKVVSVEDCRGAEIKNVTFPETIKSFGESLYKISSVFFPSSVTDSYYKNIFGCNNIVLPNCVQAIGRVLGCNMLTIPSSVISIEEVDDGWGWGSTILKLESSIPPVLANNKVGDSSVIIVPNGALEAYKNDPMWGKFKTIREDPTLGKGTVSAPQQTLAANDAATEKEIVELKQQLAKKDEEIANLKNQLAKKDEEIAELKRQSESKKASTEPKPEPTPAQPKPVQPSEPTSATAAVPKANGVFKLADYKSKGKLCHTIVKTYVEQHPDVTLAQLKQAFNVPKCDCIVESLDVAMTMTDSSGKLGGNHYVKEAEQIKINEGIVVVWNYWPERYYPDFIANARKAGFTIE